MSKELMLFYNADGISTHYGMWRTISTPSQKLPRRKWPVNAGEIPSMTRRQRRMLTDSEESLFGEARSSTLTSHIGRMQFFTLWTFRSGCRCL